MKRFITLFTLIILLLVAVPNTFAQKSTSITEITIEESSSWVGLMGKFVLRSNGTATAILPNWKSQHPDKETETYQGKFYDYARLAKSLEAQGFFRLKDKYLAEEYDLNIVIVSVIRNGKKKEVENYGDAGPLNLSTIEYVIRGIVKEIKWEKVTGQPSVK